MDTIKPQTPAEAITNFLVNTSFTDMLWIIIGAGVGYILFLIARRQYRRNSYTIIDLATWGIVAAFTGILTYSVLGYTIGKSGFSAWGWYSACLIIAFLVVYAANKDLYKYQRVITTLIVIVIGSCLFWSFIEGEQSIMYGIMTGVLQGSSLQLFITTFSKYISSIKSQPVENDTEQDNWDNENRGI